MKTNAGTRKIVKYGLLVLTTVCIYIILCIGLGWFWEIGHIENAEKVNSVLINLSYSYMAGFVFFILIEYIPKRISSKKAFLIWRSELETIYRQMSDIISSLKMIIDVQKKDSTISLQDLSKLCNYSLTYEKVYFSRHYGNTGDKAGTKGIFRFHNDLLNMSKSIKGKIENIIQLPSTPNIDIELVEVISAIYSSKFLRTCSYPHLGEHERGGIPYTISEFDKDFYDFIKLHERFGTFDFVKVTFIHIKLTDEEIVQVKAKRQRIWSDFQKKNIVLNDVLGCLNGIEFKIENGVLVE